MTYDPLTFWNERAINNGALYVAKGCAQEHYQREYREFEPCLRELVPTGGRLLDFGCGSGRFTSLLSSIAGEYVGADISPEGIELAEEKYPEHEFWDLTHSIADEDKSFDTVVAVFVVQHMVDDFEHWMREFRRVLRPAGSLVVIDRDPWDSDSPLAHMLPRGHGAIEEATRCKIDRYMRANADHWCGRFVK